MNTADPIHLEYEGWCLQVSKLGGCILSCTYEGQAILRPTIESWHLHPDPLLTSCFPLVPFSNRIANGKFTFNEHTVQLPTNHPDQAHPIHGYGWISEWALSRHSKDRLDLSLDYVGADWPWAFKCVQSVSIKDNRLTLALEVTNAGMSPMPAGLGFHPYFPGARTASLKFKTDGYWQNDHELLPTKWQARDCNKALSIADHNFDNCFTDWDGGAEISWSTRHDKVQIEGDDNLNFAVLYSPKEENYFCFEPVSHMNNGVNFEGQSIPTGLQILKPGETMKTHMILRVISK